MFKNYIKIAFRNIYRHFTYSAINILGLAIGLASAIVISLWVWQEWSYDRHFKDADQIYRVGVNFMNIGDMAVGPPQLNEYVREFPEVEQTALLNGVSSLDIFIGAGITAIAVALTTISYQALKATLRNPVDSLRSE